MTRWSFWLYYISILPPGWWQLKYFLCSPRTLGKMNPFWRAYFSNGLVQPPSRFQYYHPLYNWVFPKIGVPQNGWFIIENPINPWMIWGENPTILGNIQLWNQNTLHDSMLSSQNSPFSSWKLPWSDRDVLLGMGSSYSPWPFKEGVSGKWPPTDLGDF